MFLRTFGIFVAALVMAISCKSISPKNSGSEKAERIGTATEYNTDKPPGDVFPTPQLLGQNPELSLENPAKSVIEPLSAGHFETIKIAFYNLENLFDTIDGPNDDAEYLPQGIKQWNSEKYQNKLRNMARVIDSLKPHILGVCEVENLSVLEDLKTQSAWLSLAYANIVHQESPDKRGIDVALFYTPEWAFYGESGVHLKNGSDKQIAAGELIPVSTGNEEKPTRSILHVAFTRNNVPFSIFVNHWPSRSGGESETRPLRFNAAMALKNHLLSHPEITHWAAMGDFNDNPEDSSLRYVLGAGGPNESAVNLAFELRKMKPELGTGLYRGQWDMFDQIIFSRSLYHLGPNAPIPSIEIYKRDWLLQGEGKYQGSPLRTFGGKTYLNGFSDHLPVTAEMYLLMP